MIKHILPIATAALILLGSRASHANEEYKKNAAERIRICEYQSAVRNLSAEVSEDDSSQVIISWQRMTVPEAVQYQVPPSKRHPQETWIALDGNAMTNGTKLNENWFKNLQRSDNPEWTYRGLTPGNHSATVAHKTECDTWNMEGVSFTIPGDTGDEIELALSEDEALDLSPSANLGRYANCMTGILDAVNITKKGPKKFVVGKLTKPASAALLVAKHPYCLIQSTGGLYTPPNPDAGIMPCHIESGMHVGCKDEWVTFYGTDDGIEALSRMGPGPAPTAYGRDNQAELSCYATIYNEYNRNAGNLDRAMETTSVISQGCNKARPQ